MADHASDRFGSYRIAVLVPCYNEETTVAKVVEDFRTALPAARVFVSTTIRATKPLSRPGRGRRGAEGDASGQGLRRAAYVLRRGIRRLRACGSRCSLRRTERPAHVGRLLEQRLDMVVANPVDC